MPSDSSDSLNNNEPSEMDAARSLRDEKDPDRTDTVTGGNPTDRKQSAPESDDASQAEEGASSDYDDDISTEAQLNAVKLRREKTYLKNQKQNLALRSRIAKCSVWAVGLQMALTNVIFCSCMFAISGKPDTEVLIGWMSSTVVQTVGIALVVAKGIFPRRSGFRMQDEEGDLG